MAKKELKRVLTLTDVFSISTGAMISSGLFILPGLAFSKAGPAMILAYLLAAILIIPSLMAKAELSTAMPKSGGTYFFIDRSLGPVLGTFGGFANWFSLSLKSAFALIGIGASAVLIYPDITATEIKLIAVSACLFFTLMNIVSVKVTGKIQNILVGVLLIIMFFYIGRGFIATHPDRYVPFMPNGIWSVFSTAGLVFVSFGGLTKIASVAEEVKDPKRNIPAGMFLSFSVVTLIYILSVGVTVGILDGSILNGSLTPLATGSKLLFGSVGMIILASAAIIAYITTANSGILASSRTPMAMSKDFLLPKAFSKVSKRFNTPWFSILITSTFMIIVILFLSLEELVKTASTLKIILFMMDNISVIIMRESKIRNYHPHYKVPLYPWLPILAIIVYCFLLVEMGWIPILISLGFFIIGWISYARFSKVRVHRVSALMHIIERITAKEMQTKTLENELREIIIERDEITEDRFDHLVKASTIVDFPKKMDFETGFKEISTILSDRLNMNSDELYSKFIERENQSCTVIRPGLAIPHIIIPGEKRFDILPIRSKQGIKFMNTPDLVHTMFVLVGSIDERNYHLRALMAIANIAQEPGFEKKWLNAKNTTELKDILLLSTRKRDSINL